MVPPARLGVQGRLLRRVGERAFPSGREEGSHRLSISPLLRRQEAAAAGGHGKEEPAAGRAEKGGSPQLPPGEALAGGPQSSRSGDRATLPTPPALLRRRRPHDPTWLRAGETTDAGRGGARRKRAAAGRPGGTTPCAAGLAAPPGPRPLPAEARAARSDGGCGPGAGPARWGPLSDAPGWRLLPGGKAGRRRGAAGPSRTADAFAKRPCGPRRGSCFWGAAAGRHSAVESGGGRDAGESALPCAPPGFGRSRRCLGFLPLCPDLGAGRGGAPGLAPVFFKGFDDQGRGRRHYLNLGLSLLNDSYEDLNSGISVLWGPLKFRRKESKCTAWEKGAACSKEGAQDTEALEEAAALHKVLSQPSAGRAWSHRALCLVQLVSLGKKPTFPGCRPAPVPTGLESQEPELQCHQLRLQESSPTSSHKSMAGESEDMTVTLHPRFLQSTQTLLWTVSPNSEPETEASSKTPSCSCNVQHPVYVSVAGRAGGMPPAHPAHPTSPRSPPPPHLHALLPSQRALPRIPTRCASHCCCLQLPPPLGPRPNHLTATPASPTASCHLLGRARHRCAPRPAQHTLPPMLIPKLLGVASSAQDKCPFRFGGIHVSLQCFPPQHLKSSSPSLHRNLGTAMAQMLSSRRQLSVLPAQSATPATPSPAPPCLLANRGHSEGTGAPINGGLPQNTSLQVHLQKVDEDINYYIPAKDFSGLAVIDWEHWRPQWTRNWGEKNVYRQKSRKLISDRLQNVSAADIESLAKAAFEQSANAFMKETIELGLKSRPHGLWGYYLYPDCHNYNVYAPNYTGSCPEKEVLRNNELAWLWNSSAALYPAIGLRKSLGDSENILHFSQFRVHESMRISAMTSRDYALPVFVYTRLDYRDEPLFFLSKASQTPAACSTLHLHLPGEAPPHLVIGTVLSHFFPRILGAKRQAAREEPELGPGTSTLTLIRARCACHPCLVAVLQSQERLRPQQRHSPALSLASVSRGKILTTRGRSCIECLPPDDEQSSPSAQQIGKQYELCDHPAQSFTQSFMVHFNRLPFSCNTDWSKGDHQTGFEKTRLHSAHRDRTHTTNFVDILEGQAKGLSVGPVGGIQSSKQHGSTGIAIFTGAANVSSSACGRLSGRVSSEMATSAITYCGPGQAAAGVKARSRLPGSPSLIGDEDPGRRLQGLNPCSRLPGSAITNRGDGPAGVNPCSRLPGSAITNRGRGPGLRPCKALTPAAACPGPPSPIADADPG
ncbi:LOW QUALITY PROTEIN: hypothetical protein QTO34_004764 [Cnephaeus nilssonii]|uniref:Hyaluronidase n=1 Tax=Cnephaeus nilssonii TaxID=3371016 RepID=A0AA40HPY8_CNENI|nr:LOW QUALITY PROTEIN: hypothetical protein QTO34_004764 [Eptesicus nilssonii]